MLKNFESVTHELNHFELECVEFLGQWFMANMGKKNAVKNADIAKMIEKKFDKKIHESRVRKVVQALRTNGLPNLIASGKGYFYTEDIKEIDDWVISLKQRELAIRTIREKAERQIEIMRLAKQARKQMQMF
jgi:uncharacterized protein YbbC (DUF1343 family)